MENNFCVGSAKKIFIIMIKLKDIAVEILKEHFTVGEYGPLTKDEVKQLLIKHQKDATLLDSFLWSLKTSDPQEKEFVSGMQKLIDNPQALQMVINYFSKKKRRTNPDKKIVFHRRKS